MSIPRNLAQFAFLDHPKVIAVSKGQPIGAIMQVYEGGHRDFGENRVQELVEKYKNGPKDIRWHMIGHLQRNKVKYIAPFIYLIHSVDSLDLLKTIDKEGKKNHRRISCLLQVHISQEATKFGLSAKGLLQLLEGKEWATMQHIDIRGLMGIATHTENKALIKKEFMGLQALFNSIKHLKNKPPVMETLSMGMSHDYRIAIAAGSTMIRIGSAIFGNRKQA